MKFGNLLKAIALLACTWAGRADASIEGRVEGRVPQPPPVNRAPLKGGHSTTPPAAQGELIHPVVYIADLKAGGPLPKAARLTLKDLAFEPSLLPIQVGTGVEFFNAGKSCHRLFSYSAPKRFELESCRPNDAVQVALFDSPGLVTVRCDEHEEMLGFILVLESPFFAVADAEGRYRLTGLPPGEFTLCAWLNAKTTLQHRVVLKPNAVLQFDFNSPENHATK